MKSVCMRFAGGKSKCVTFSYDDGTIHDIRMTDAFKKYNVKATLNLNSGIFIDGTKSDHIDVEKVKELAENPLFEIACHGTSHPHYERIPASVGMLDIVNDRIFLENTVGKLVRGAAYPYGTRNEEVIDYFKKAGIVYSRTTKATNGFSLPENWLEWHPTCHHKGALDNIEKFLSTTFKYEGGVLYIWGHSYEFNNDNNWDLLDEMLKKLSDNSDDIWFATNIEIYNYVEAFKQLVFYADGTKIYNPTTTDIYIATGCNWNTQGTTLKVPAGETVEIN